MSETTATTTNANGEIWSEHYRQFIPEAWADKELTWDGQRWMLFEDQTVDADDRFRPGDHNVAEVIAHLEEHPEDRRRVLAAERRGQARKGILGED